MKERGPVCSLCSRSVITLLAVFLVAAAGGSVSNAAPGQRARARALGIEIGILQTGELNSITDVPGVLVGHSTVILGTSVRTGVTAILPHGGNLFRNKVPAAIHVANGFGKLTGISQVRELGNLETPILLTSTLSVPRVADALISHMLSLPGNEDVRSVNPVVGETNDGYLNDIRARPLENHHVEEALRSAHAETVAEGNVGAGTGTMAFGFKGGIGTASRHLPAALGGWTVGVLVQSNFGGILTIAGAPVGVELGQHYLRDVLQRTAAQDAASVRADGSCMIVLATDAPLLARNLERLAARAIFGMARVGGTGSNGSGDYVIAFSSHPELRRPTGEGATSVSPVANRQVSPLFLAAIEATEEAIVNSLLMAESTIGFDNHRAEALPLEATLTILRRHGVLPP